MSWVYKYTIILYHRNSSVTTLAVYLTTRVYWWLCPCAQNIYCTKQVWRLQYERYGTTWSLADIFSLVTMLNRYRLATLFSFLLLRVHQSAGSYNCYSYYCSYSWSGWTSTTTDSTYQRSYCSADDIYCKQGRSVSATRCPDRDYQDIVGDVVIPIKKDEPLFAERLTKNRNSAIKFSSEDARYMTARMISTLDSTVNELPSGFSLVVVEGYQDISEGSASFPLQYEGMHCLLVRCHRFTRQPLIDVPITA